MCIRDSYRGVKELRKLQSRNNDPSSSDNTDVQMETLKIHQGQLQGAISASEEKIGELEEAYRKKLQVEAPHIQKFEELDIKFVTASIIDTFSHIRILSNAFNELNLMLNTLYETFNRKIKDKAVTDNMNEFVKYTDNFKKSFRPDGSLDVAQRDQIIEYLQNELPTFLLEGKSKYTPEIVVAKSKFVRTIINVKIETKNLTLEAIEKFRGIVDSIIQDHDVNLSLIRI